MKKLITAIALTFIATSAHAADPLGEFRRNGHINRYGIDFAMQNEVNHVLDGLKDKVDAANASTIALTSMPEEVGAVSMGMGTSGKELGIALGYTESFYGIGNYKFNLSTNSDGDIMVGAGCSLKMW